VEHRFDAAAKRDRCRLQWPTSVFACAHLEPPNPSSAYDRRSPLATGDDSWPRASNQSVGHRSVSASFWVDRRGADAGEVGGEEVHGVAVEIASGAS
jgi:hypothetical protein